MKQEIPKPVIIGVVVVAIALLGFFVWRSAGATQEFAGPKIENTEMPAYIKEAIEAEKKGGGAPKVEVPPTPQGVQPTQNPYGNTGQ
jgi:hypothetical protein